MDNRTKTWVLEKHESYAVTFSQLIELDAKLKEVDGVPGKEKEAKDISNEIQKINDILLENPNGRWLRVYACGNYKQFVAKAKKILRDNLNAAGNYRVCEEQINDGVYKFLMATM